MLNFRILLPANIEFAKRRALQDVKKIVCVYRILPESPGNVISPNLPDTDRKCENGLSNVVKEQFTIRVVHTKPIFSLLHCAVECLS